jgi:hypothetical protein
LIEEGTTLVLGTPYLGKWWHVERQLGDAPGISITKDLPTGRSEGESSGLTLVDDFHRAYQRAERA